MIRIGVVGVGSIGAAHAVTLATSVAGASVSAVTDPDAQRAAEVAARVGARVVGSAQELIDDRQVDAVVIASPDALHAEQALACLVAGKPTLCEKPLAPGVDDARSVLDAEVALGRRLVTMGFMRRFDPGYVQLKTALDSGSVGAALLLHCIHRNESVPTTQTSAMSLTNSVVHEIDINRWLLGEEYASVQVITGRPTPNCGQGVRDPLLVILRTVSGVIVEVEAFANARYGYDVRCEVVASEGTLELGDGGWVTSARAGQRRRTIPAQWLGRFADAYRLELQAWIDSISRSDRPAGPSLWDGYAATAVANACVTALDHDGAVPIALVERPSLYA